MNNKGVLIAILLVVFIIIAVVVYMFANSGSKTPTQTVNTSSSGLGNLLDHLNLKDVASIFTGGKAAKGASGSAGLGPSLISSAPLLI